MKNLSNNLTLNKRSIQILDDKALVDIRGGANDDKSCKEGSCNEKTTCWFWSCEADAVQQNQGL